MRPPPPPPPPPLRLCAAHPSNHLVVQELLLHAALGRKHFFVGDRHAYLKLAKHIAQLPSTCAAALADISSRRGPAWTPWRQNAPRHVVCERIGQQYPYETKRAPVFYDDAAMHQQRMEGLLQPHGFRVALVGTLRCGCPVAPRALFLLTRDTPDSSFLTEQDKSNSSNPDLDTHVLFRRAVRGLGATGYIKSIVTKNIRMYGGVVPRYVCAAERPHCGPDPFCCKYDSAQELVLSWAPPCRFHVRRFFLTGPRPFVAHLMLLAHVMGYELMHDGLYRWPHSGARELVALRSEKDLFTTLQIPYVDPLHRHAYCRLHNLL
ncbi:hypothetical protein DQ04_02361040 [Trypanosoma grayi]|uniref:hypothetical protein n=1 Tax=Trypanosoma grayi TaxID=71804 RepID=UPI0004F419C8|nr:hypothetical protein DQ04_02361040 [Trypanosoma grayi]KEG11692.1 hypothetical protein DQ04_02361040 [Trypanosoma grayi]